MKKSVASIGLVIIILLSAGIILAHTLLADGIIAEITAVTISDDGIPTVAFTMADKEGNPLMLDDVVSVRFLIAYVVEDDDTLLTSYVNYFTREAQGQEFTFNGETVQPVISSVMQPTFEPGEGVFEEIEPGQYTYTFGQPLGEDYDERNTHVVGAVIVREPTEAVANPTFTFVPDGDDPDLTRVLMDTQTCNNCHNQLAEHGGSRQAVEVCVLCHTPDNVDPESGNSLDLKVMIHRIHAGADLPSVQAGDPYYIVGFRQSVHDYSNVEWPQDIRNCTTCHTGVDDNKFLEFPNAAACTSCHDDVDPTTAFNHPGNPKDDEDCYRCHESDMIEFDEESILGSHLLPQYSTQISGVNLEILSVGNVAPGQSPIVTFKVTRNDGESIAPAEMGYLAVTVAGPTSDYTTRTTETIFRTGSDEVPVIEEAADGAFTYTMAFTLPEDASQTFAFGLEGYAMEEIDDVDDPVRIAGFNPVVYVSTGDGEPQPRRQVVNLESCNNCHKDLALHGTVRQNTEYCVLCHNPNATDEARRPEEAGSPVSISFGVLVHRIHRGAEANQPLQVYGFNNTLHDYSSVGFPGIISDCTTCHLEGTYDVELPGLAPISIMQDDTLISQILPARALCTSCHDTDAAGGHAEIETTSGGIETCEVCHGTGREFDVVGLHD